MPKSRRKAMADTNNGKIAVLNPVGYPPKITPK
jgi:hypothetical protein